MYALCTRLCGQSKVVELICKLSSISVQKAHFPLLHFPFYIFVAGCNSFIPVLFMLLLKKASSINLIIAFFSGIFRLQLMRLNPSPTFTS